MLAIDVLFNAALLAVDALAVAVAARSRPVRVVVTLGLAAAAAAILAVGLAAGLFHGIRLAAFAVFGHSPVVLAALGWARRRTSPRTCAACWLGAGAVLAVAGQAFLIEPHWLEVRRVRLDAPGLSRPVRIAVVADLQAERIGDYEKRVLRRVIEAEPDLVLMPGDYVHVADRSEHRRLARELRQALRHAGFDAPLGIFAVRGNTEPRDWPRMFDGTRVRPMDRTRSIRVGELVVTGLSLGDSFDPRLHVPARDAYHVVFGHAPDFALGRIDADLLVAGHTHGGQVRVPFLGPILTLSGVPRSWADGVTRLSGNRTLVVSRGIGMERGAAPRLRLGCRPEIVIVDLLPHTASAPAASRSRAARENEVG